VVLGFFYGFMNLCRLKEHGQNRGKAGFFSSFWGFHGFIKFC